MTLIQESPEAYQARKALSAGMAWEMVNECPLLAWFNSPFNPDFKHENAPHFDVGTATHLAVLEPLALSERIVIIDHDNYRTNAAKDARDGAYAEGKTPLLADQWKQVERMRQAIFAQTDVFQGGHAEVSYVWEWEGVPCKARVDYIVSHRSDGVLLIDLKSASSANPTAFQRAMIRDGHHLRAAWYLDGWNAAEGAVAVVIGSSVVRARRYRFVVVGKDQPHIVTQLAISERSTEWGRRLYRKALGQFRKCISTGLWPGYTPGVKQIDLPTYSEHALADMEATGDL